MNIIEATRDFQSLERYLPEFIEMCAASAESAWTARRRELRSLAAINPERLEAPRFALRIPHCFALWILHLGELDTLSVAAAFTLDDLTAEEARGLAMLRRARAKFWDEHARCAKCNAVNPRYASCCAGCGWSEKQT